MLPAKFEVAHRIVQGHEVDKYIRWQIQALAFSLIADTTNTAFAFSVTGCDVRGPSK